MEVEAEATGGSTTDLDEEGRERAGEDAEILSGGYCTEDTSILLTGAELNA